MDRSVVVDLLCVMLNVCDFIFVVINGVVKITPLIVSPLKRAKELAHSLR